MDIEALQATLRTFAAERDWQAFHTPKNLSTALIVEAAELAEIFQWMTPEQSMDAHNDAVVREQIADEVADVLLYLLQIADHAQVDLKRAVGRKLVKNAKKHPPTHTGLPTGKASTLETHVLVDWENVHPREGELRALVPDVTDVWIFHGPNQKLASNSFEHFGLRATPVKIARSGKNALDFHLSFYMGYIASRHPNARFVVISNDKGYGPMLEHAGELGFSARQATFGAPKATAKKASPATKKSSNSSPPAVKTAVAVAKKAKATANAPAKKAAPAKTAAKPAAKSPKAAAVPKAAPTKKIVGTAHVAASLKKTASKPARLPALLAMIQSLLGTTADDLAIQKVLSELKTSGKVVINDIGAVQYHL